MHKQNSPSLLEEMRAAEAGPAARGPGARFEA
jgi:hypothetical protein